VKRPAVAILSTLALLLCVGAWIRSYLPENFFLRLHKGSLVLIFAGEQYAEGIDPANYPVSMVGLGPPGSSRRLREDTAQVLARARLSASRNRQWRAMGFEVIASDMRFGHFVVVIPFWAIFLPLAGLTSWAWVRWYRRREWQQPGRCQKCGYDLRATSDRCPECGTPVKVPESLES